MSIVISIASGRGKCFMCQTEIPKGTKQLIKTDGHGRWAKVRRYCANHGEIVLSVEVTNVLNDYKILTGQLHPRVRT